MIKNVSLIREQQIGLLEVVAYLAAIMTVVGTVVWGWDLNLLLALILGGVAYAVMRDLRALWLLRHGNDQSRPSGQAMPSQRSSSHPQARRSPLTSPVHRNARMGSSIESIGTPH